MQLAARQWQTRSMLRRIFHLRADPAVALTPRAGYGLAGAWSMGALTAPAHAALGALMALVRAMLARAHRPAAL
ncbi:MAG: hypothetical protein LUO93_11150, partial [Methanomicrobiales archaeon]|nr:hypothetical protein [Methanomicrobiales archaeon]